MWSLAANKSFYTAPSRPPWSGLPSHALSPELFAALPSAPELINISEQVGTFIPLHSQSIDVRMRDPSTVVGRPVKVGTIRGYPYSIAKMFRYDSIRSRPKGKEDWIEGFRWSCMESYLKHLYAFSMCVLTQVSGLKLTRDHVIALIPNPSSL
jgi:hypothetical protein